MLIRLFVGNLPYNSDKSDIRTVIQSRGVPVSKIDIIRDSKTGKSKGFGFVDVEIEDDVSSVTAQLQGLDLDGRALTINEAQPKQPRREVESPFNW